MKLFTPVLLTSLIMVGCQQQPIVQQPAPIVKPKPKVYAPKAPKKDIELKEVEDENFSSEYMYPETAKKSKKKVEEKVSTVATSEVSAAMTKTECLSMIGQEKFDKYAQMLGSDAGAIKKCAMLKAL